MAATNKEVLATTKVCGYSIDFLRELCRGAFGTVYRGYDDDGNSVAIKKVSKHNREAVIKEAVKFYRLKEGCTASEHRKSPRRQKLGGFHVDRHGIL